jgi:hypothetical protein
MAKDDIGYQTTVRVSPLADGRSRFEHPFDIRTFVLNSALPVLWGLVAAVLIAFLVWW